MTSPKPYAVQQKDPVAGLPLSVSGRAPTRISQVRQAAPPGTTIVAEGVKAITEEESSTQELTESTSTSAKPVSGPDPESLLGSVIADRYRLLEIIGQGGIGVVYKAQHTLIDRIVAFKMLRKETLQDERSMQRFQMEGKAMTSVSHPNIVSVFDFGVTANQSAFLVMEFLDGTDLDTLIQAAGYLEPDEVVALFIQICDALSHLHERGLIHRDLKPANVIILNPGVDAQVKLVDFGMAKFQEQSRYSQSLTRPGEVFGSPYYMSPEQCVGMQLDLRSDIYSMGCVMYEALSGRPPFLGENMVQLAQMHLDTPPDPISVAIEDTNFPRWLDAIVLKCLAKNVNDRYQSAEEMKKALVSFQRTWLQKTTKRLVFKGDFSESGNTPAFPRRATEEIMRPASVTQAGAAVSNAVAQAWQNNLNKESESTTSTPAEKETQLDQGRKKLLIGLGIVSVIAMVGVSFFAGRVSTGGSQEQYQRFDADGTTALETGHYSEAEYNFSQAVKLAEQNGIKDNQPLFESLINLATVYQKENKNELAEDLYKSTITRIEEAEGKDSGNLAPVLIKLGKLYTDTNRLSEAEAVHQRAKNIVESAFGSSHKMMVDCLNGYAETKKKQGELEHANKLQSQAQEIIKNGAAPAAAEKKDPAK